MFSPRPGPRFFLFVVLLYLQGLSIHAAAQVVCTPVYVNEYLGAGGGALQPHALKALADGTILIAGRAAAPNSTTYDGFVSRHAADGTPMWSFFVGGPGDDDLNGITPLNDGTYLLFGITTSFGHSEGKGWLVHIDANGAVLWSGQLGSSATSTDRIKAAWQYTDGDIIGTLNTNDSSAASDPVVFKLGLDGTVRWTHRFDNGTDDSFTTLAVSGDTVYAGGYYTSGGLQQGVIAELNATTGAHLQSRTISNGDATLNEQVTGLEIYNNEISYGLYVNKGTYPYAGGVNGIVLVQTDLAGNTRSVAYNLDVHGLSLLACKRSADSGFYVLRTDNALLDAPMITKVNWYGSETWNRDLFGLGGFSNTNVIFQAFDMTPDGGVIAAGHYFNYLSPIGERLRLVKLTARGTAGTCDLSLDVTTVNPASFSQSGFTWAQEPAFSPVVTIPSPTSAPDALTITSIACSSSVCVDQTPIPSGCGKTYNIQYTSAERTILRDALPMPDGGKVAVGDYSTTDGLVTRYQSNGAIAWTKNYNIPGNEMQFRRILQTADGNLLVLGNSYGVQGNYATSGMVLLKLDINGNILSCHFWDLGATEMTDVAATPDNGFVALFVDNWGSGASVFPWLARFDANANLVWKKQVTHGNYEALFRSIACSQDAIFVAYDNFLEQYDRFGIDRLDLATGNLVYSQLISAGAGTETDINRIFTVNDSAYVFIYRYNSVVNNVMVALDQQGNLFHALNLGTDPLDLNMPASTRWTDEPLSVTITPDQDFWLANRVIISGTDYLEVTKIKRDGTVELCKLHPAINGYLPFNVHPQGKGLVVVGANPAPETGDPDFISSFVLKLDSSGQLQTGAAANCTATDRPFAVSTCTDCATTNFVYGPPATTDGYPLTNTTGSPYNQNNDITAVLYCYQPGTCNAVNVKQKGVACALNDTLTYYLDNSANCGAAATWTFDPAFFRPGLIAGDSIQLIIQKAGATTVGAQVEGYCQYFSQSTPANIVFSTSPGLGLAADTVICSNGPITLYATAGFATYLWSDNSTADSLRVSVPGQYSLVATDLCGQTSQATVAVTDANAAFHVTPDTVKCNNDVDSLRATGGYSGYQWNPAYNLQASGNIALVSPDVTTSYTVTAQRSPGCTVTAIVVVTALSSPAINLGNDTSICSGDSLLLDAGAGFSSYLWNTGAGNEQIYIHTAGTYSLIAYYPNGCISRDSIVLDSLYSPKPLLDTSSVICIGQPRTLDAAGPYTSYLWNDGSTGTSLTVSGTGTYWVQVADRHGCLGSDTVQILTMAPLPNHFLTPDTTICQYGDLVLTTNRPYDSYSWSDLTSASTITIQQPGTYWVMVTDNNGCTATDTVVVMHKECLVGLFVPNAFTPNGNGHNNLFRPLIYGEVKMLEFAVFDRYGQRVYETQTPLAGWDGRVNGSASPTGTYAWYCKYQLQGEAVKLEKGTVILIR